MWSRLAAIAVVGLWAPAALGSAPVLWVQAQPDDHGEAALRQAIATPAGPARTSALAAVSASHPGSEASGLAQLAAGLELLEAEKAREAIPFLRHPDVAKTALGDRALLGLARAQAASRDLASAGATYLALVEGHPRSPAVCSALFESADALAGAGRADRAVQALDRMLEECPGRAPEALLRIGAINEARGNPKAAALAYDRLDREYPAAFETRQGAARLRALRVHLPAASPAERLQRDLARALALSDAGRYSEAATAFRSLLARNLAPEQADMVRVRFGRALLVLSKSKEARTHLAAVAPASPFAAEAAYHLARIAAQGRRLDGYEAVATRFPGSPWAEEALLDLAHHYHKDARDAEALPYYRRLLEAFPGGRYADRAVWALAWWDYRKGRLAEAADLLEKTVRDRPRGAAASRFLYWAGRARERLGQADRARALFEETVRRFKHLYHGLRAAESLGLVQTGASSTHPALDPPGEGRPAIPEPELTRIRQLLLIERLDDTLEELRRVSPSPQVHATVGWIEWRRGQLRPAITAMKRAYPDWYGEDGDELPGVVWRILYPLSYGEMLVEAARRERLDPALVAAIIWQESTFDAGAVSSAGARGLMQVVPPTGRSLARRLGVRYRGVSALHDPSVGLRLGTRYFREMLDRYGGRVERALAAYNAGPTRVRTWTAARPEMSAEEFIEGIPFTETRTYVTGILAHQEHYRRLYGLPAAEVAAAASGSAP